MAAATAVPARVTTAQGITITILRVLYVIEFRFDLVLGGYSVLEQIDDCPKDIRDFSRNQFHVFRSFPVVGLVFEFLLDCGHCASRSD